MSANEGAVIEMPKAASVMELASVGRPPTGEWEQRILQFDGRRYSLRLEPDFWTALEAIAERRKQRLNRLVAEIAMQRAAGANLSSALRVFCLAEIQRGALSRPLPADRTSLLALAESAPLPCLVFCGDQKILTLNHAFARWVGVPRERLLGEPVLRHFLFPTIRSLAEMWAGFPRDAALPQVVPLISIEPGRLLTTNAKLTPVPGARGRPLWLVWLLS
jgi:predicted DNA-binding ribbon-helix-helix protein